MLDPIVSDYQSLFQPGTASELRAQRNLRRRVTLQSGHLVGNLRSDTKGVSARVYKGGLYGFSSSAELNRDAAASTLTAATENAVFLDSHVRRNLPALPAIKRGFRPADSAVKDLSQQHYIDFARTLDEYISRQHKKLTARAVHVFVESIEKQLCTSDGFNAHTLLPRAYIYLFMTAETDEGKPVEVFKTFGGHGDFAAVHRDPSDLFAQADELYEHLMRKREGVFAQAGVRTCVLGGALAGMLAHEAVGHTVEADLVLGGSVAAHNMGRQVASPLVSMTDFAHTAFGRVAPLPVYVDDEGVEARDANLIRDGILTGYMHSRETGRRFDAEPKGNARAFQFSDEPLIRMRNTAVHPGHDKLEDMIASVDRGYYLMESNNGQADMTGEFMFGISMGYEIQGGRLGRAIHDTTISGVAFEMLKTVDMVSDSVEWSSSGYCGKKQPMPVGLGGPALRCEVMIGGR